MTYNVFGGTLNPTHSYVKAPIETKNQQVSKTVINLLRICVGIHNRLTAELQCQLRATTCVSRAAVWAPTLC